MSGSLRQLIVELPFAQGFSSELLDWNVRPEKPIPGSRANGPGPMFTGRTPSSAGLLWLFIHHHVFVGHCHLQPSLRTLSQESEDAGQLEEKLRVLVLQILPALAPHTRQTFAWETSHEKDDLCPQADGLLAKGLSPLSVHPSYVLEKALPYVVLLGKRQGYSQHRISRLRGLALCRQQCPPRQRAPFSGRQMGPRGQCGPVAALHCSRAGDVDFQHQVAEGATFACRVAALGALACAALCRFPGGDVRAPFWSGSAGGLLGKCLLAGGAAFGPGRSTAFLGECLGSAAG